MFNRTIEAVKTPLGSISTAIAAKIQASWADWGSGLVDAFTDILGLVVVLFLAIHWYRQLFCKPKDKQGQ